MSTAWLGTLPQFLDRDSFSEIPADTTIRSKVETGLAKVRNRYTAGVDKIQGRMTMSKAQWVLLKGFYKTTLGSGALPFSFTHPTNGVTQDFRFGSAPTAVPSGWTDVVVSLDWEVLP